MMASPQNYWNWPQNSEPEMKIPNLHLLPTGSPLIRRRDDDGSSSPGNLGLRMKPKMKKNTGLPGSPINSPRTQKRIEEDKLAKRIRESYACLRHRAMHKRCPAECPDRRIPKPLPVAQERKQVQQQQQLQQQISQQTKLKNVLSSGTDSPLGANSPNTLRVLQAFQNARISSPGMPRIHGGETKQDFSNLNFAPPGLLMTNHSNDSSSWDSTWDTNSDISNWSSQAVDSPLMEKEDWADSAISSNWDTKSSSDEENLNGKEMDYWLDPQIPMIQNNGQHLWNVADPVGGLTIDLSTNLDMNSIQLFNELPMQTVTPSLSEGSSIANLFKILLTRDTLERWMYDDCFNKSLRGFYVRVRIAEINGIPIFRIGCIVEARDHCFETYRVGEKETQKGLVVHFGSYGQHLVSLTSPSNDPPNDQECEEWIEDAEKNHINITQREVDEKIRVASMLNSNHSPPFSSL